MRVTHMVCHLEWDVWVELKLDDSFGPGLPFVRVWVDVEVEQRACRGHLEALQLQQPPLAELHASVRQLPDTHTHTHARMAHAHTHVHTHTYTHTNTHTRTYTP
jgi:hypothetical protein